MRFRRLALGLARSSVRSDTGVEVRVGIPFVIYRDGDHVLRVGRELAFRASDPTGRKRSYWMVALNAPMRWEPPHQHEQISPEKRKQIEGTITAALAYLKIDFEIY